MPIYLKDTTFIHWKTLEFSRAHLKVEAGERGGIRFLDNLPDAASLGPEDTVLDCRGKLVTKAFGCGHHHVYSALARGMGAPKKVPKNFHEVLQYIWWTLDKSLTREMVEASAYVTAMASAKNGVTFVIDHHASPFAVEGSLETIARAFDKVGVGHLLCYELSDRDGEEVREQGLAESETYLQSGRAGLVGLHASFTVEDYLLEKAADLARQYDSGIHVHTAEDPIDQERCLALHGTRVVERFKDAGVLASSKTILAHCLHLEERERQIISGSPVYVAQNSDSNLNNGVGNFRSQGWQDQVILGTDGMHSDMLRSAKSAFLLGQAGEGVSSADIYQRLRRIHSYLEENRFSGDGENNLVILNYDTPTEINSGNFLSHFIYGLESRHVESVIAKGKLIMREGKLLTVEEEEILSWSRELGKTLWQRMAEIG